MTAQKSFLDIINERLESDQTRLPAFSHTALQVQREVAKKDPDDRLIEKLVISDQALTAQVLRVANSAFYKGLVKVETVRSAIVRLGLNEVANIVLLVSQESNFRSRSSFLKEIMSQLWRHSVGCALGARWVARECGFTEMVQEVFFAGLLHDVGKVFVLTIIDDLLGDKAFRTTFKPSRALVFDVMSTLHTHHGYSLMQRWNLPEPYCRVARDHHLESFDHKDFLLAMVRLANLACNKIGMGLNPNATQLLASSPEADILGMSEVTLAQLEISLEDAKVLTG
jgi:HD-like signal output (HDOD) protein